MSGHINRRELLGRSAGLLAGLGAGIWSGLDELQDLRSKGRDFEPQMDPIQRQTALNGWQKAVKRSQNWEK